MESYKSIPLTDNKAIHNYELMVDGHRSFIDYREKGDKIYLVHTEVPEELKGKGVAEAIVEKAFEDIEARHLKMIPSCPYVQVYLKRHPDWQRIVAE